MPSEESEGDPRLRTRTPATFPRRRFGSVLNFASFYVSRGYLPVVAFWAVVLLFVPAQRSVYVLTIGTLVILSLAAAAFHFFRARRRELASFAGDDSGLESPSGRGTGADTTASAGSDGGEERRGQPSP